VLDDGPLRDHKEETLKYIDGMAAVVNDNQLGVESVSTAFEIRFTESLEENAGGS
jgi:hypothetical protein